MANAYYTDIGERIDPRAGGVLLAPVPEIAIYGVKR